MAPVEWSQTLDRALVAHRQQGCSRLQFRPKDVLESSSSWGQNRQLLGMGGNPSPR
jgi:hypothetical protein